MAKYITVQGKCSGCGKSINVHQRAKSDELGQVSCSDCKMRKEEERREGNFWKMIGDCVRAKASGRVELGAEFDSNNSYWVG